MPTLSAEAGFEPRGAAGPAGRGGAPAGVTAATVCEPRQARPRPSGPGPASPPRCPSVGRGSPASLRPDPRALCPPQSRAPLRPLRPRSSTAHGPPRSQRGAQPTALVPVRLGPVLSAAARRPRHPCNRPGVRSGRGAPAAREVTLTAGLQVGLRGLCQRRRPDLWDCSLRRTLFRLCLLRGKARGSCRANICGR